MRDYCFLLSLIVVTNCACFSFICSMLRYLLGITEEERQRRREEILSTR